MVDIRNAMTIDVEDYFQVSALENVVKKRDWEEMECRVEENTTRLIELFNNNNVTATFFILGWVAEHYPHVIRMIADSGHEVASHGMDHTRVTQLDEKSFSEDVGRAKKLLEDTGGKEVVGYRAPSFSFTKENTWVYDSLMEHGYLYSSSVYPVKHDLYGVPDASRFPYFPQDKLLEIPLSTLEFGSKNIPISGGGFFRLYPYALTKWAITRFNSTEQKPYIFYLHPWEIDPQQPRVNGLNFKSRFRHYLNLEKTFERLEKLIQDFSWGSMQSIFIEQENRMAA